MFALIISALGVVLGGLFIGGVATKLIGETRAKYASAALAVIAVTYEIGLAEHRYSMASIGLLVGLAALLLVLLRKRRSKAVSSQS